MTIKQWRALYSSLAISVEPYRIYTPLPSDEVLDQFEVDNGIKLPKSYRSFVKVFGAGELAYDFKIMAPGYPPSTDYSLKEFNLETKQFGPYFLDLVDDDNSIDRLQRSVYFAHTETGEVFGWDPKDVRQPRQHEYAVYEVTNSGVVRVIARTFSDFIEQVCLGEGNLHPQGWDDSKKGSRRRFEPVHRPK